MSQQTKPGKRRCSADVSGVSVKQEATKSEESPSGDVSVVSIEFEMEGAADQSRSVVGCAMEIQVDAVESQAEALLIVDATIQGKSVRLLVDSGATHRRGGYPTNSKINSGESKKF